MTPMDETFGAAFGKMDPQTAAFIAAAFEASCDYVALVDRTYRILYATDSVFEFQRSRSEEVLGRTVAEVFGRDWFQKHLREALDQSLAGEPGDFEIVAYPESPEPQTFRMQCIPFRPDAETVSGTLLIVTDITELNKLHEELHHTRHDLELIVRERTLELNDVNRQLRQEIKTRILSEKKLRESESRFRVAFELGPIGMAITSVEQRWIEVNDRLCAILGYPREELLNLTWAELTYPDDLPSDVHQFNRVLQGEIDSYEMEKRFVRKDGEVIEAQIWARCIRKPDGGVDHFLGLVQDITERKRADRELQQHRDRLGAMVAEATLDLKRVNEKLRRDIQARRRAEEAVKTSEIRFGALMESTDDIVASWDNEGRLLAFNKSYADRFRDSLGEPPRPGGEYVEGCGCRREGWEQRRQAVANGQRIREEFGCFCRGQDAWFETSLSPIVQDGEVVGGTEFTRDITDRKRAEEERRSLDAAIAQAQKLESLQILAGGVAHDFNNLLVGVLGQADLAKGALPEDSPALVRLEEIEQSARRMAGLADQMLAYSGRGRFISEPMNIGKLMKEMASVLRSSMLHGKSPRLEVEENLPCIDGDPTQIRQIIMNLLVNAAEAANDPESFEIGLQAGTLNLDEAAIRTANVGADCKAGRYVVMTVEDNGGGMDRATLRRIFDPFYTTKFTGRGLGLAAVQGIVRGHQGIIHVSSTPGKGTRFQVSFPASTRSERPATEDKSRRPDSEFVPLSGTVLVIDDDSMVREVAMQVLENAGARVRSATQLSEALSCHADGEEQIDVVLLDMTLPGREGIEPFGIIREKFPGAELILTSGYSEEDLAVRPSGHTAFLKKPFTPRQLVRVVADVMGRIG